MAQIIRADVLIPGRGAPIERGVVVLDGDVITYAGPASGAPSALDGDTTTEVPVALPGLWDSHAHFVGTENLDSAAYLQIEPHAAGAVATVDAKALLHAGVTSVREVGGFGIDLAAVVERGVIPGPRIHAAGRVLSTTGGHGDLHSLPIGVAFDACERSGLSIMCDGVPEVLRAVRTNLRKNAKVIKLCASGGVMSEVDHPMHQQFSDEELAAAAAEAARAERVVAAHCHGKAGIMAALRAGCRTIEHGSYLDEEAADFMLETGAMLVPTRYVIEALLGRKDELPDYAFAKGQMIAESHARAMEIAVAKGVPIAMGCDIFQSGDLYRHGSREIRYLVQAGMTDLQAIEAATANGPLTLGPQAPQSGQLVEGFDADVIALDANPLEDRTVWGEPDRVTHVWQRGALVK